MINWFKLAQQSLERALDNLDRAHEAQKKCFSDYDPAAYQLHTDQFNEALARNKKQNTVTMYCLERFDRQKALTT